MEKLDFAGNSKQISNIIKMKTKNIYLLNVRQSKQIFCLGNASSIPVYGEPGFPFPGYETCNKFDTLLHFCFCYMISIIYLLVCVIFILLMQNKDYNICKCYGMIAGGLCKDHGLHFSHT